MRWLSFAVLVTTTCLIGVGNARAASPCKADPAHLVKVCFDEDRPVSFDRCTKELKLKFSVDLYDWHGQYKYEVNIYKGQIKDDYRVIRPYFPFGWLAVDPKRPTAPPRDLTGFPLVGRIKSELDGSYVVTVRAWDDSDPHNEDSATRSIPVDFHRNIRAIIFGVSHYDYGSDNPGVGQIANLRFAAKDAEQVFHLLSEVFPRADETLVSDSAIVDHDASSTRLKDELNDAAKDDHACQGDLLILYFSGHTFISPDINTRWIGTADFNPTRMLDGFSYADLIGRLRLIKADKLLIFDSCYSGLQQQAASFVAINDPGKGFEIDPALGAKAEIITPKGEVTKEFSTVPGSDIVEMRRQLDSLPGITVAYSAAEANVQAQEVAIIKTKSADRHFLFMSEKGASESLIGHGLYTYFLLRGLERQMSKSHSHSNFADDQDAESLWKNEGDCGVDFSEANREAVESIRTQQRHLGVQLQVPGEFGPRLFSSFECKRLKK
jgi:Caspase domain